MLAPKVAERLRREKEEKRNQAAKAVAKQVAKDAATAARSRRATRPLTQNSLLGLPRLGEGLWGDHRSSSRVETHTGEPATGAR